MATLTATLTAAISALYQGTHDVGDLAHNARPGATISLASGTGANQANAMWADTRTLTASSTENLDLAAVLTDAFGTALTFTKVKAILVMAAAGNTNNVVLGGAASNAFINWVGDATDVINIRPGGVFMLAAPDATAYAVTASTGDILKVANSSSGTSVTYTIVIIGVV